MELKHIHEKYQEVAILPIEQRLQFLQEPRWVGYPQADSIFGILQEVMQQPKSSRPRNILLVGEPNNGKTTIIRRFFDRHGTPSVELGEPFVKPIVLAESPPNPDEKALYISILERFWSPYRATDPIVKLRFQVLHLLRDANVKMLIIDEFHSLLTGTPVKQREIMNALKMLCNEIAIPIVGVGTADAIRVLHTDPQHASRFDVVELPTWKLDKSFQRIAESFGKTLPLHKPSMLGAYDKASLLHTISDGNLGNLRRLIVTCAKTAIETGTEEITVDIIKRHSNLRPTKGIRRIN